MDPFIKQKIKRVSYFLVTVGGGAFLFLTLSTFEAHHEFIRDGGLAQVFPDPTEVYQFEEGLERIGELQRQDLINTNSNNPIRDFEGLFGSPDVNNPIRDFEGLFGGPDANNPIRDFEGLFGSPDANNPIRDFEGLFGGPDANNHIRDFEGLFGGPGANNPIRDFEGISGSQYDTSVRIISPDFNNPISDFEGLFGSPDANNPIRDFEGLFGGPDANNPIRDFEGLSGIGTPEISGDVFGAFGTPGFNPAGEIGGAIDQVLGDLGGAVNGALGSIGLSGIDFGAVGDVFGGINSALGGNLGGILSSAAGGNIGGAITGALSGVLGETGIGGALGGIFGGSGLGSVVGLVGGLFGGGGGFVPVKDFTQISLQQQQVTKEYNLDPVAYLASKTTIRGILGNVLNWINTGDNGNPYYVTNTADHFRTVDGNTVNVFLTEIQRLGLNPNIQRSLALSASPQFAQTIQPTVSIGARDAFLQDFNNGGWEMWLTMLQSHNNPLGQYDLATEELERRRREAAQRESQELAWGNGFKPATVCVAQDFAGNCVHSETVTPGTFIETQMAGVFSSVIRQLEADDELGEITNSLLSNMMAQILGGGRVTGLRGFSPVAIVSPQADALAVARSKEGLAEAIGILLDNELGYYIAKTSTVIRLREGRDFLSQLLALRPYFAVNEPLKTRLSTNTELNALIETNRFYATSTIQTFIDPKIAKFPPDIALSVQNIERIRALAQELGRINTPQGLSLISDKYLTLFRRVHTLSDVEKATQEFEVENILMENVAGEEDVRNRLSQEQALVEKIKDELSGTTSN